MLVSSPYFHAAALMVAQPTVTAVATSSSAADDRDLIRRMASGDERALSLLHDRYVGVLYAVAYRIAGERVDAEEIVLETLTQAWRGAWQPFQLLLPTWVVRRQPRLATNRV